MKIDLYPAIYILIPIIILGGLKLLEIMLYVIRFVQ